MLAQVKKTTGSAPAAAAAQDEKLSLEDVIAHHKRVVVLLRGVPGSHKSTVTAHFLKTLPDSVSCSADHFFVKPNGDYEWYAKGLGKAHQTCRTLFEKHLSDKKTCVFVDNTNIKTVDYQYYLELAKKNNYYVVQCVPNGQDDSIHDVPKEKIVDMRKNFQEDPAIPQIKVPETQVYRKEELEEFAKIEAQRDKEILASLQPTGAASASASAHFFRGRGRGRGGNQHGGRGHHHRPAYK